MIHSNTLKKSFTSKQELFAELKKFEYEILAEKKANVLKSCKKKQYSTGNLFAKLSDSEQKALKLDSDYVYPVINTTRYMDMHDDVHADGIWKKTLLERAGKIYYVDTHQNGVDNIIAFAKNVEPFTAMVDWAMVGKNYAGQTQALIFKIAKSKIRKQSALDIIEEKIPIQGSVSMQYVKIDMAVDFDEDNYKENKILFDKKIDLIANKEKALKQGYFFWVSEAKIPYEGSMVILGSNDATEMIYPEDENKIEPPKSTQQNIEPPISTQTIDYKFLIQNFKL